MEYGINIADRKSGAVQFTNEKFTDMESAIRRANEFDFGEYVVAISEIGKAAQGLAGSFALWVNGRENKL